MDVVSYSPDLLRLKRKRGKNRILSSCTLALLLEILLLDWPGWGQFQLIWASAAQDGSFWFINLRNREIGPSTSNSHSQILAFSFSKLLTTPSTSLPVSSSYLIIILSIPPLFCLSRSSTREKYPLPSHFAVAPLTNPTYRTPRAVSLIRCQMNRLDEQTTTTRKST